MRLPNSDISIMDVRNTIGYPSTDLGTLCSAGEPYINKWAKFKPVIHNCFGSGVNHYPADWYKGTDGTCGIGYTVYGNLDLLESSILNRVEQFTYQPPIGGVDSPYRLGDFANYDSNARPPILVAGVQSLAYIKDKQVRFNLIANADTTYSLSVNDVFEGFFISAVYYGIGFKKAGWNSDKWKWMTVPFNASNVTELVYPLSPSEFEDGTYQVIQFLTHTHRDYPNSGLCQNCMAIPTAEVSLIQSMEIKKEPTTGDLPFTVSITCWFKRNPVSHEVEYGKVYYDIDFSSNNGQTHNLKDVRIILAENKTGAPQHNAHPLGTVNVPSSGMKTFTGALFNGPRGNTGYYDQFPVIVVKGEYEGRYGLTFADKNVLEVRD